MNKCSSFLLFSIFALTTSISQIKLKEKHGTYYRAAAATDHINEETRDTNNVDYRNNFVAKVKDGKKDTELVITAPEVETFTDFIQEAVDILNTYDNTAFKDFFHILDTEIRKYHYEGCRFSELMQNRNTRTLLAGALKSVRENTVTFTKANINEIADLIRYEMYDEDVKELLNYINSLYITTERDFHRILNNLKLHTKMKSRETHNDLEQVIRDGVRTVVFNHYTDLNTHTRRELKEKIEIFWEKYKKSSATKDEINSIVNADPVSNPAINNIIKTIEYNPKELEPTKSDAKNFLDQKKRIVGKDTYDAQFQDNKTKNESIFESDELTTNVSDEETSSEESEDDTGNTKSAIQSKPVLRAQEELEPETRNTYEKPSTYSTTTESSHSKLGNKDVLKDVKPKRKSADRFNKTDEIIFLNKIVHSKITTMEENLNELKQLSILGKRLIHIDSDEDINNFTDSIEIIGEDNKRRHMKTDILKLLQGYYDLNKEEIDDAVKLSTTRRDKIKTKATTNTNKRFDRNVPKMRAGNAANINESTKFQVSYAISPMGYSKLENKEVLKDVKPKRKSADRFNKTGKMNFLNKFVNSKVNNMDETLNELKQLLGKRLIRIDSDEDKNVTDSLEIIGENNNRRYMRTDIKKLRQAYYDLFNDEIESTDKNLTTRGDEIKTKSTTKTNKRSDGNIAKMRADNTENINDNTTYQVLRQNVNDTVTKELKTKASSNDTASTNSTVDSTSPQTVVTAVTVPTAGNNTRRRTIKNPFELIHHLMFN